MELRAVVLVEGTSDRGAVEALARRRGRDLASEGVAVVPMGGYGNLPRFLERHRGLRVAGLYDASEERHFLRALGCADRAEVERAGFYACERDLEDELTRALGPEGTERVLAAQRELRAFRTYQKQPAHRHRPPTSCMASYGTASRRTRCCSSKRSTQDASRGRSTVCSRTCSSELEPETKPCAGEARRARDRSVRRRSRRPDARFGAAVPLRRRRGSPWL